MSAQAGEPTAPRSISTARAMTPDGGDDAPSAGPIVQRPESSPSTWAGIWALGAFAFLVIARRSLRKLV